jgi:hypothetical protein
LLLKKNEIFEDQLKELNDFIESTLKTLLHLQERTTKVRDYSLKAPVQRQEKAAEVVEEADSILKDLLQRQELLTKAHEVNDKMLLQLREVMLELQRMAAILQRVDRSIDATIVGGPPPRAQSRAVAVAGVRSPNVIGSTEAGDDEAVKDVDVTICLVGELANVLLCYEESVAFMDVESVPSTEASTEDTRCHMQEILLGFVKWTKTRVAKLHRAMIRDLEADGHEGLGRAAEEVQVALDAIRHFEIAKAKKDGAVYPHSDPDPALTPRVYQEVQAFRARLDVSKNRLEEIMQSML